MRPNGTKTVVQCDFDGTITIDDISFLLLDSFAKGDWRKILKELEAGKMSVGQFNREAFAMVKEDRPRLVNEAVTRVKVRPHFVDMANFCRSHDLRLVIVSNGLDFYIDEIFKSLGLEGIEIHAAQTDFDPKGLRVKYIGPGGTELEENFKGAFVDLFLSQGYRVVYIGNGNSDAPPAKQCHYTFATDKLLEYYRRNSLTCTPFTNFKQVVKGLESLR